MIERGWRNRTPAWISCARGKEYCPARPWNERATVVHERTRMARWDARVRDFAATYNLNRPPSIKHIRIHQNYYSHLLSFAISQARRLSSRVESAVPSLYSHAEGKEDC